MSESSIQDTLAVVQMPSRYLGSEVNRIKKDWDTVALHVVLAFPDLYEIATSHFGIQILYHILNSQKDTLAERVFAPAADLEEQLRTNGIPMGSLESATPLRDFDIIGFSLLYELNYTNMLNMLDLAGIAFLAADRKNGDPLLIAGGPCTCNPEPVADFFDAMVIGDGEDVILQMTEAWKDWRHTGDDRKERLLERWSRIQGVYIPSFFDFSMDETAQAKVTPRFDNYKIVEKAVVANLDRAPIPFNPIIPFGKPIHDRLRLEIARGCTRGCRFCQAGMIYRPVRERQPDSIVDMAMNALQCTGYEDLSLLSLSTGDYSCIAPLINQIMRYGEKKHVAVSLPSLRAGSLTPALMEMIRKVRKTGFTIAPEAGSQRLRNVINKNISEADIVDTVTNAFSWGWKVIKLYFMIGLPTETQEDLEAIVALVKRLTNVSGSNGKKGRINVSVATFVPKPHTPFQWEAQISLATAMQKMKWLKDNLRMKNVHFKWQDPRVSQVEGIWSRGDRRLGKVLIDAWKNGCRFDGWTDFFNYNRWAAVFNKNGIDLADTVKTHVDSGRPLPWDHIHFGIDPSYLIQERMRALEGKTTADCRTGNCCGCGVCDFKRIKPITYDNQKMGFQADIPIEVKTPNAVSINYRVSFKKMGLARFLGHLEMVKLFIRAIRRAGIPIKYSQGFHPMPKISFEDTLPMGMQSECEQMWIALTESMDIDRLIFLLQEQLPEGMEIISCFAQSGKKAFERDPQLHYRIKLIDGFFQQNHLEWFKNQQQVTFKRKRKKAKVVIVDLKKAVSDIRLVDNRQALMTLGTDQGLLIRPAHIMKTVFNLTDQQIRRAIVTKRKVSYV